MPDASRETILVTGAAGFVGSHLSLTLSKRFPSASLVLCDVVESISKIGRSCRMDITDPISVESVVSDVKPTTVVHLAALASVGTSHADPQATLRANVLGTSEVLKALERHAPGCHFLFVSSAEVYGESASASHAITENDPIRPLNPYAESKVAAEALVIEAGGNSLHTTIVRPFNHTGPGQSDRFVVPAFCSQIARIERGLQPPTIWVGELNNARDFLDVQDVVDLYARVIEQGPQRAHGLIVNACSGRVQRVGDILQQLLSRSRTRISVETDPARLRPNRQVWMVGNPDYAREKLGWQAKKPFEQTLDETLDYWRNRP